MKEKKILMLHQHVINKFQFMLSILFLCFILPTTVSAHRGNPNDIDTCRIPVGDEVIHFTAYIPELSGGTGYCQSIPGVGKTHLVFDYEGKKLRHTTVEFEITKEPEGSRIFYQAPEKIVRGTVDAKIDFTQFGEGYYLAHVTIINDGQTLDSHLDFSVGLESAGPEIPYKIMVPLVITILIITVMMFFKSKRKPEELEE